MKSGGGQGRKCNLGRTLKSEYWRAVHADSGAAETIRGVLVS